MLIFTRSLRGALGAALIAFPLTVAFMAPAQADITRGCSARITVAGVGLPIRDLVLLDARGSCDNRFQANTCRIRASELLQRCFRAVQTDWADHNIPLICRPSSGGRTGMNYFNFQGIFPNLPNGHQSIEDRIRYESCCSGGGRLGTREVRVDWSINGDRGCTGTTDPIWEGGATGIGTIWENVITECTQVWDAGYCTGPRPQGSRTNPTE